MITILLQIRSWNDLRYHKQHYPPPPYNFNMIYANFLWMLCVIKGISIYLKLAEQFYVSVELLHIQNIRHTYTIRIATLHNNIFCRHISISYSKRERPNSFWFTFICKNNMVVFRPKLLEFINDHLSFIPHYMKGVSRVFFSSFLFFRNVKYIWSELIFLLSSCDLHLLIVIYFKFLRIYSEIVTTLAQKGFVEHDN